MVHLPGWVLSNEPSNDLEAPSTFKQVFLVETTECNRMKQLSHARLEGEDAYSFNIVDDY